MKLARKAPHESKIYHRLSHVYDCVFTPFFMARIHDTIRRLNIPPHARVLELGVGTGLSLEAYPTHAEVVGVDLSESMLEHARQKIEEHGWNHIQVQQMDALNLEFPDQSFDYVMAFHLVTVVPDVKRLMHEMSRVCRTGGTIVVINHLRSPRPWIAGFMDALNPITRRMGWQTKLSFENLVNGVPLHNVRRYKTSPHSLFTVMIAERTESREDRDAIEHEPAGARAEHECAVANEPIERACVTSASSVMERGSDRHVGQNGRRKSMLDIFSRPK